MVVEARNANESASGLFGESARYWDCLHGSVTGADAVAAALRAGRAGSLLVETLAGDATHAVVELRVAGEHRNRRTEVYAVREDGRIAWCRAYFDPEERPAQS